jgi:hypothetical protein
MIACLLPAADLTVHVRRDETAGDRGAQEQMIDPKARIPGPGVPEVVPEGVNALIRMERAECIGPPLSD